MQLEDLQANASIRGLLPDSLVTVVGVQWFGSDALELTYKTTMGKVANELLYRHDEPRLEIVEQGRPWSFDGRQRHCDIGNQCRHAGWGSRDRGQNGPRK